MSFPSYQYGESLDSGQLRLLTLTPSTPTSQGDLHCTLQAFDLHDPPKYVALSYSWGDPDAEFDDSVPEAIRASYKVKTKILVHGKALMIPTNLYNALLALQVDPNVRKGLPIWADAACINQQDDIEKSAQVNVMSAIYTKAELVIVWLGLSSQHTKRVMKIIKHISRIFKSMGREASKQIATYSGHLSDENWPYPPGLQPINLDEWYAVAVFLSKTWFYRAWTLQESALARDTVCLCGRRSLKISHLYGFSVFAAQTHVGDRLGRLLQDRNPLVVSTRTVGYQPHRIFQVQYMCKESAKKLSAFEKQASLWTGATELHGGSILLLLLWQNMDRKATDMRDKIFSLLGILEQVTKVRKIPPCPLIADYSKTTAEVYIQASRYILESTGSLGLLSLSTTFGKTPLVNLPSWASEFRSQEEGRIISSYTSVDDQSLFDASKSSSASQPKIFVEGECLHVYGLKLGATAESVDKHYIISKEIIQLVSSCDASYWYPGEEVSTVLCKTLTAHQFGGLCSSWEPLFISFRYYLIYYMSKQVLRTPSGEEVDLLYKKWLDCGLLVKLAGTDTTPAVEDIEQYSRLFQSDPHTTKSDMIVKSSLFRQVAGIAWGNRLLFRTERGHIGLGPKALQPGDSVWVLSGGRSLFILRQIDTNDESRYRLVGEAYVHGVMYGEAVKDLGPEDWQKIVIE
jgi:hypothetical protein